MYVFTFYMCVFNNTKKLQKWNELSKMCGHTMILESGLLTRTILLKNKIRVKNYNNNSNVIKKKFVV